MKKEKRQGSWRTLNALVYCLVLLAVFLGGIAAWKRYSQRWRPGEPLRSEPGDAIERRIEAFRPNLRFPGGLISAGGLPQAPARRGPLGRSTSRTTTGPMCRFTCPQCRTFCWTQGSRGCPACPFCGRAMVRRGLAMSPVGGAPAGGAASPITIQADAIRNHGDRGVCTNCHTMAAYTGRGPLVGAFPLALTPAGAPSTGWRPVVGGPKPLWRGVAAPAIAPNTVRPTLVKEFGIEVCPAPGAGAKVTGVMGNSYASNAGLRAGDIVIECNGARVRSVEELQQLVSRATPEADAQIKILRNGRTRDLSIMVGEGEMEGFTPIQRP